MSMQSNIRIFNKIAPVYALFFGYQLRGYRRLLKRHGREILTQTNNVLDIGCGTGALVRALSEHDLDVCGVDRRRAHDPTGQAVQPQTTGRGLPWSMPRRLRKTGQRTAVPNYDLIVASLRAARTAKRRTSSPICYMRTPARRFGRDHGLQPESQLADQP
jgi:SAM-dependent methyltransferase